MLTDLGLDNHLLWSLGSENYHFTWLSVCVTVDRVKNETVHLGEIVLTERGIGSLTTETDLWLD